MGQRILHLRLARSCCFGWRPELVSRELNEAPGAPGRARSAEILMRIAAMRAMPVLFDARFATLVATGAALLNAGRDHGFADLAGFCLRRRKA